MLHIDNVKVFGWEAAIRGMRNPINSWEKSDSGNVILNEEDVIFGYPPNIEYQVGQNDLKLMKSLVKSGTDHSKFMRMINVTMDITAPLYWLKEFDTYKVGTVTNSCSTMHKIHSKEFSLDDFSYEHLGDAELKLLQTIIEAMNESRSAFVNWDEHYEHEKKDYWWQMIQLLPSSYNQKRTVQLNYQVLRSIYHARKTHKLDEWHTFCKEIEKLPYAELIVD